MSNADKYFVRIKTLRELTKGDPDPPSEFVDEEDEIYQMFKKYGGRKLWVWASREIFYSNKVLNDEELKAPKYNRFFYRSELTFLRESYITLDEHLFEL